MAQKKEKSSKENKKFYKFIDDSKKELLEINISLHNSIKSEIEIYTRDKQYYTKEILRRRSHFAIFSHKPYSDTFVINQISFLRNIDENVKLYREIIRSRSALRKGFGISAKVEELNNQLIKLLNDLIQICKSLSDEVRNKLGYRYDEVNKALNNGQLKMSSFGLPEIINMFERRLEIWDEDDKYRCVNDLFRYKEYLTMMEDELEDAINKHQESENKDFYAKLQYAYQLLKKLQSKTAKRLRQTLANSSDKNN